MKKPGEPQARKLAKLLEEPIGQLGLSVRICNALEEAGVLTVRDLLYSCRHRPEDCAERCQCRLVFPEQDPRRKDYQPHCYLLSIANFGEKTLREVFDKLAEHGFHESGSKT